MRPSPARVPWVAAGMAGPVLTKCCLFEDRVECDGEAVSVPWGATLAEVMRRAGHVSSRAALLYQHAADQRDAAIADLLSAYAETHLGEP